MDIKLDMWSNIILPKNIFDMMHDKLSLKEKAESYDTLKEYTKALENKVRAQNEELKKNADGIKAADALRNIMGIAAGVVGYPGPRG